MTTNVFQMKNIMFWYIVHVQVKHHIQQEKPFSSEHSYFLCHFIGEMIFDYKDWHFFPFRIMWNDEQNSKTIYNVSNDGQFLVHVNFHVSIQDGGTFMSVSKMAARSDAAAAPGPKDGAFMSFNVVCPSPNSVNLPLTHKEITPKHIYDRRSLLDIGNAYKQQLAPAAIEKLRGLCLLLEPDLETAASPTDATRTRQRRKRCERGRKRSKCRGMRARLRANPTRPALPTLMLSNVRSLENKLDLIQLSRSTQHEARDCCVFVFTETWLNDNIPDSAIQLNKLTCCRSDRDTTLSGKSRGGGLCVYINKEGVTILRYYQNTAHHWWSLCLWSVDRSICRGSSRPLLLSRFTFHRVQTLRTRFVNCIAPSVNNKQITPTAFSS